MAAVISDKTAFEESLDIYNIAVAAFYERVKTVLNHTEFDNLYMIFKESQRGNHLNRDYFSRYSFEKQDNDGNAIEVNCEKSIMSKKEREPGLEVADFIAHTAGASVQSRLTGKRSKTNERKDFQAVFKSGDPRLSSFLEITKANPSRA